MRVFRQLKSLQKFQNNRIRFNIHKQCLSSSAATKRNVTSIRFDLTADDIASISEQIQTQVFNDCETVAKLDPSELTPNNTLLPMINTAHYITPLYHNVAFLQSVSPDKELRNASTQATVELSKFFVDISMRRDVYKQIKTLAQSIQENNISLPKEWNRYLDRLLRDFRRSGLDLNESDYDRMKAIQKRISELEVKFRQNLNEENTEFTFTQSQLEGCDTDWLSARKIDDNTYKVTLQYPDYMPLMDKCAVDSTRAQLEKAFNSRCIDENSPIMEELVQLRHEKALLLGKTSHCDFVLDVRVAKSAEKVWNFLSELNAKLDPLAASDMDTLLQLKKEEKLARNETFDGKINPYDFRYYLDKRLKKECTLDDTVLRQYFPLQTVINGCLEIYQQLLSLKFRPVNEQSSPFKGGFWHNDVQCFEVIDMANNNGSTNDEVFGYFLLDLYPREGKYGHACLSTLSPSCAIYDGFTPTIIGRQRPINCMICNFPKPTADKPSLLSHNDVVTFFHEFGHAMHQIMGQTDISRFSGTAVERDFVEAPSQMLENWCWFDESLQKMSAHYETKQPLSSELITAIRQSRNLSCGLTLKRQLFFSIMDQTLHGTKAATIGTDDGIKASELASDLATEIWGIPPTPDTNMLASFAHLAGGYDSGYYGYVWSEVYSSDMFTKFGKDNLLSADVGLEYREKILAPGGSKDGLDLIQDFLGREPNMDAFLRERGLAHLSE